MTTRVPASQNCASSSRPAMMASLRASVSSALESIVGPYAFSSEERDQVIEVVRRFLRTPSFLVRYFPLEGADPADGRLDVVAIEAGPRLGLIELAYRLRSGGVADRRPGVERPDTGQDPEADVEEKKRDPLLRRGEESGLHEGQEVEAPGPRRCIEVEHTGQNQGAPGQEV